MQAIKEEPMKTEEKLGRALKDLMAKEPLDQISVKRLTAICGINRQTFYYHFRDIYDLLTWIFLNETIQEIKNAETYLEAIYGFFAYIEKNKIFVMNVASSAGKDLFVEFLNNHVKVIIMRSLQVKDEENVLTLDEKKFIAKYFGSACVAILIDWITSNMKEPKNEVIRKLVVISKHQAEDCIEKFKLSKKG